jgi:hypothetical protein
MPLQLSATCFNFPLEFHVTRTNIAPNSLIDSNVSLKMKTLKG